MIHTVIPMATWFCIAFGVMLLTAAIMDRLSKKLYTHDVVLRKFNIMDLQFPAEPKEIRNLIRGIFELPDAWRQPSLRALKAQLWVDFLFMPAAYGAIFILCRQIAVRLDAPGDLIFQVLAGMQVVALIADVYENCYLLNHIKENTSVGQGTPYNLYKWAVAAKWICALLAVVCALAVVFYFWITGNYHARFFTYAGVLVAEIAAVFFLKLVKVV